MAELMDHPFISGPKGDPEGETKLTVLRPDDFIKDQKIVSQNPSNLVLTKSDIDSFAI